ncbi:MotA/TolQ/ExbB proton channel family protein [Puniceicoccus vermicola]|uniref:MotA/TolQ/ExbB proton channel family protein n=1 Tax=Puniceicoccus vermicola TaxID=388746 RepID=A0A7X1E2R0_9BACT|nr:MotA/TolQ/ExbB proton channel family protein [Puniceicoccus vermicola]MBC2600725.1 MotA/TolQ/ExbB proton channel family protein [Puniceicoccus vermicola]
MKIIYSLLISAIPTLLLAQDTGAPVSTNNTSLFGMIQQGGWAMIPLAGCSLAMLFLIIYSYLETRRSRFIPDALLPQTREALSNHDVQATSETLKATNTVLGRSLAPALLKLRSDRPNLNKEQAENLLVENLEAEENSVSQWVNYLNVVAAVAPMIGLLGTVSGMISAFQTIGQGGMGRPELLAGDIGEALITTATGLVIGIPAMIFYFILRNRLGHQMIQTTQTASELIDAIDED